ncbi:Polyamine aminopropyltransferase [uncultured archaeon]|nr:Polyamine aminopropyltransferase [uncultured archaeon]
MTLPQDWPNQRVTTTAPADNKVKMQVVETSEKKLFNFDGATFSKLDKRSIYTRGYWDYFMPLAFVSKEPRILMIGLGGGTIPYQIGTITKGRAAIDSVEIDPKIAKLAKKFVPRLYGKVIIGDGCDYVMRTRKRYDLVILDAYEGSARIPKQFTGNEFVENAHRILSENGVLAINYALTPGNLLRLGIYKYRLRKKFSLYSVKTTRLGDMIVLLGLKRMKKEALIARIKNGMVQDRENADIIKRYSKMRKA